MNHNRIWISKLTNWAFAGGMVWVLAMMLLTAADVTGRYLFSRPISGSIELSEFMLAIFGMLGMGYTERMNANVRVTILEKILPERLMAGINALMNLLSSAIIGLLAYQSFILAIEEFHYQATSDNLGIPVYPFYVILSLSAAILVLVLLSKMMDNLRKL